MNILVRNLDGTGLDTLICDTSLNEDDIATSLNARCRSYDSVETVETPPYPIPDGMSLQWFTPRGEYEVMRLIAMQTPGLADAFPEWEKPRRRRRA